MSAVVVPHILGDANLLRVHVVCLKKPQACVRELAVTVLHTQEELVSVLASKEKEKKMHE